MSTPTKQELQDQIRDAVIRAKLDPSTANKDRVFTLWQAYQNKEYQIPQFLPPDSLQILHPSPERSKTGLTNTSTWAIYNWDVLSELAIHVGGIALYLTGTTAFNTAWDQALGILLSYREHAAAKTHPIYWGQITDAPWDITAAKNLYKTLFFPFLLEIPAKMEVWWGFYNFTGQTVTAYASLLTLEEYSFI